MDVLLGKSVRCLGKTVRTALVSIHHLCRDDLAFREVGHLPALLMSFWGIWLHTNFLQLFQDFCGTQLFHNFSHFSALIEHD